MDALPEGVRRSLGLVATRIGCLNFGLGSETTVIDCGGRNWNLTVRSAENATCHVKLPAEPDDFAAEPLRREVHFYDGCRVRAVPGITRFLPRLIAADRDFPFLVLEVLQGATPLAEQLRHVDPCGALRLLRTVGEAMGTLHAAFRGVATERAVRPVEFPWALSAHRPGTEWLRILSPATAHLLRILQGDDGFLARLDDLRSRWKPGTLIHSDIKSDNVLICPTQPGSEPCLDDIRFIDWETVRYGDPAWDVASLLQDVAFLWIRSMCDGDTVDIDQMLASSPCSWPALQQAIRGFWDGYCARANVGIHEGDDLLGRAVSFSAARMIQTAWEVAQTLPALPVESVLLLQVASNLLGNSDAGRTQFYGLDASR